MSQCSIVILASETFPVEWQMFPNLRRVLVKAFEPKTRSSWRGWAKLISKQPPIKLRGMGRVVATTKMAMGGIWISVLIYMEKILADDTRGI